MKHSGTVPYNADVVGRVERNDSTMANTLMRTRDFKYYDNTRGVHGAARARKSAKKATSAARRRLNKRVISSQQEE